MRFGLRDSHLDQEDYSVIKPRRNRPSPTNLTGGSPASGDLQNRDRIAAQRHRLVSRADISQRQHASAASRHFFPAGSGLRGNGHRPLTSQLDARRQTAATNSGLVTAATGMRGSCNLYRTSCAAAGLLPDLLGRRR